MARGFKKGIIWREAVENVIPTNPTVYVVQGDTISLTVDQEEEEIKLLGKGREPSRKSYGNISPNVSLGLVLGADTAPIIFGQTIGKAATTAPASAVAWSAALTVATAGTVVNHSDGFHSLVSVNTGTTGGTEPDLSAYPTGYDGRGVEIVDNGVIWTVSPLLVEQSGIVSQCLPSLGVELLDDELCSNVADIQYQRVFGAHSQSMQISVGDGIQSIKSPLELLGNKVEDSLEMASSGGTYEPMSAKAGYSEILLSENHYTMEDILFYIDGISSPFKTTSFEMSLSNNITKKNIIEGGKKVDFGSATLSGSWGVEMDAGLYADAIKHKIKGAKLVLKKHTGELAELELPSFTMARASKEFSTEESIGLSISYGAFSDKGESALKWRTVSPIAL